MTLPRACRNCAAPVPPGAELCDPCRARLELETTAEPPSLPASIEAGRMIAGRYRLVRRLGRGGMGTVWQAHDESLRRSVAIKLVRLEPETSPHQRHRVEREAWIGGRLVHPNIVRVYDTGTDGEEQYVVMELVGGGTLHEWLLSLRAQPPVSSEVFAHEFCDRFIGVVKAVAYCHDQKVLHRDIKPSNVLLDTDGHRLLLSDFGLARDMEITRLTRKGDFLGTVAYMAPEQVVAQRATVDERADIWALGVTLYEALTLKLPFAADSEERYITALATQEPIAPSHHGPRLERDLETIVLKCLRRDPRARYASALELSRDLERYLAGTPIHARRETLLDRSRRQVKRNWRTWATIVIMGATALGVMVTMTRRVNERQAGERQLAELETAARLLEDPKVVQGDAGDDVLDHPDRYRYYSPETGDSIRALLKRTGQLEEPRTQRLLRRLSLLLAWTLPTSALKGQDAQLALTFAPVPAWHSPPSDWILAQYYRRLDAGEWTPVAWMLTQADNEVLTLSQTLLNANGRPLDDAAPHRVEVRARVAWIDTASEFAHWADTERARGTSDLPHARRGRILSRFGLIDTVVAHAWPGDSTRSEWRDLGSRSIAIYSTYGHQFPRQTRNADSEQDLAWIFAATSFELLVANVPEGAKDRLRPLSGESVLLEPQRAGPAGATGDWLIRFKIAHEVRPTLNECYAVRLKLADRVGRQTWLEVPLVLDSKGIRTLSRNAPAILATADGSMHGPTRRDGGYQVSGWLMKPSAAIPEGMQDCILSISPDRDLAIAEHLESYAEFTPRSQPVRVRFRRVLLATSP